MIEIREKLLPGAPLQATAQLKLPFELRQKSRFRARLTSGEQVALSLRRGEVLRGGDLLVASDRRVIEVVAEPERVLHIECSTVSELTRVAYHLGNRHVPVEVGDGFLRICHDHVLEDLVRRLGATVSAIEAPFEPEAGAYDHHAHDAHPGHIHEYGEHSHARRR